MIWLLLVLLAVQFGQLVLLVMLWAYVTSPAAADRMAASLLQTRGIGRAMLHGRIASRLERPEMEAVWPSH